MYRRRWFVSAAAVAFLLLSAALHAAARREPDVKNNGQRFVFNYTLAKAIVEYASAVYMTDLTALYTWTCSRCNDLTRGFETCIIVDVQNCLQAFVGVDHNLSAIIVAIRGTQENSIQNWIKDMIWKQVNLNYPNMPNAKVHSGFYSSYNNTLLRPTITNAVRKARKLHGHSDIIVTGHSMGGAIASFCALDLALSDHKISFGSNNVHLMTFGQPRVGNAAFASYFAKYVPNTIRITHERDIVPHLPPYFFFLPQLTYRHFPREKSEEWMTERVNQLKEKISGLFEACTTTIEQLKLVDTLQHLSIDHHFNKQILAILSSIHGTEFMSTCLHEVALRFRLLRQQGFWVSPDEFNRFKDENGNFDADITNDARGLLSLYNAAYLFTHGEAELEEAILFARQHLESMRNNLEYPLAQQVNRALHLPLPRTFRRVEALHYISEYKGEPMHNPSLIEFAKLDFDLLQRLHLKELKALSGWWKDLYNEEGLTYSRDRVVECYLWSYTAYYEKEYSRARMILAKIIALIILTDDTYDARATLEECRKFNEAIQRWEESAVSILPDYLKKFYLKLMNIFREFEDELKAHEKYRVAFSRKAFQILSSNYLQEAEWSHGDCKPRFKDQVKISTVCSGAPLASVGLLVGMGDDVATKEAIEWASGCTDAVKAFAEVTRFMNDLTSFKRGKNKNDVANSVECYISEHGVTTDVACAKIDSLIEDAWKTTNRARFEQNKLLPAVQRVVNITVSMPLMYGDKKDVFTFSDGLKGVITRLFLKPVLL